ncbi:triosephosphate isomerase [Candidatus Daviesbacteria bacterium]|nr:triosephosphate isomerase [Candidatus Daviesbacteria bacterium]
MNKNLWIIANFKSRKNIQEVLNWIGEVGPKLIKKDNLKIAVCPSYSCLSEAKKAIQVGNFPLLLGSQNLSNFPAGAYTGEEPAEALKEFVDLSIIGHSERRQNFKETNEQIAQKIHLANQSGIEPLLCIQGEDTLIPDVVKLVAYEPVFAIGTGTPDTPENANKVALSVKQKHSANLEVLYGGSVDEKNVKSFINQENINGILVGNASLDPLSFLNIINNCLS